MVVPSPFPAHKTLFEGTSIKGVVPILVKLHPTWSARMWNLCWCLSGSHCMICKAACWGGMKGERKGGRGRVWFTKSLRSEVGYQEDVDGQDHPFIPSRGWSLDQTYIYSDCSDRWPLRPRPRLALELVTAHYNPAIRNVTARAHNRPPLVILTESEQASIHNMAPRKAGQPASWEVNPDSPKPEGETRARRSYAVKELVTSESRSRSRSSNAVQVRRLES